MENGTLFFEVDNEQFGYEIFDEKKLREEYEKHKNSEEQLDLGTDDEAEIRASLLRQLEKDSVFSLDEFNAVLDKEFSVFKEGESYDYVKDLQYAYENSLRKS